MPPSFPPTGEQRPQPSASPAQTGAPPSQPIESSWIAVAYVFPVILGAIGFLVFPRQLRPDSVRTLAFILHFTFAGFGLYVLRMLAERKRVGSTGWCLIVVAGVLAVFAWWFSYQSIYGLW